MITHAHRDVYTVSYPILFFIIGLQSRGEGQEVRTESINRSDVHGSCMLTKLQLSNWLRPNTHMMLSVLCFNILYNHFLLYLLCIYIYFLSILLLLFIFSLLFSCSLMQYLGFITHGIYCIYFLLCFFCYIRFCIKHLHLLLYWIHFISYN